ncbi:hypothetical protein [Aquirufa antheringensis]|uniref:hypothetical protein n=1 Tax=Aquirufa antheringensis TaxID=2516559 RepID=UPI0022A8CA7B|nr:hypothetical protein [Aquirufa antheringensis]MCZ2486948.1 hypothetical protein [Aquirufa antheringensis]
MKLALNRGKLFDVVIYTCCVIYVFIVSIILSQFYTEGDQYIYNNAYDSIKGQSLLEGFINYKFNINTDEPMHFLIIWFFSNLGFPKYLLMALSNVLLISILYRIFLRWNVHLFIFGTIVIFNFYLYVLFFAAERLKFGFIFFLFSYYYFGATIKKYLYLVFSFLSHVQILIFPFIFLTSNLNNFFSFKKVLVVVFIGLPFCLGIGYYMFDHLLVKYIAYSDLASNKNIFLNTWQVFLFMTLTMLYTNKWVKIFFIFFIIAIFSAFLGPERITMIAFIYFMYYGLQINRGINFGVLFSSFYYSIKTAIFVYNIIFFNNGFAE